MDEPPQEDPEVGREAIVQQPEGSLVTAAEASHQRVIRFGCIGGYLSHTRQGWNGNRRRLYVEVQINDLGR